MTTHTVPANGWRTFAQVLVNTALANVTTSYLWFGLTFWVYIETRSVLATGIVGGTLHAVRRPLRHGVRHDRGPPPQDTSAMVFASSVTLAAFLIAGGIYLLIPESGLRPSRQPACSGCSAASSSSVA